MASLVTKSVLAEAPRNAWIGLSYCMAVQGALCHPSLTRAEGEAYLISGKLMACCAAKSGAARRYIASALLRLL